MIRFRREEKRRGEERASQAEAGRPFQNVAGRRTLAAAAPASPSKPAPCNIRIGESSNLGDNAAVTGQWHYAGKQCGTMRGDRRALCEGVAAPLCSWGGKWPEKWPGKWPERLSVLARFLFGQRSCTENEKSSRAFPDFSSHYIHLLIESLCDLNDYIILSLFHYIIIN